MYFNDYYVKIHKEKDGISKIIALDRLRTH